MADLSVKTLALRNPFIIAASPATQGRRAVLKWADAMPGAVVLRNYGHESGGGSLMLPSGAALERTGEGAQTPALGGVRKAGDESFEEYCQTVRSLRDDLPAAIRLWVSIGLTAEIGKGAWEEKWAREAAAVEHAGADAIELHLNTPGIARAGAGAENFPGLVERVTRIVKAAVTAPVVAKLPMEMIDPLRVMQAAVAGGADAVGPTGRWKALVYDLDWEMSAARPGGGYSGSQVLPIVCNAAAEARKSGLAVPVFAGGGVFSAEAAMKLVLAGSDAVQLGTFACCHGPAAVKKLIRRFADLMDNQGYAGMPDVCGRAAKLLSLPAPLAAGRQERLGGLYRQTQVAADACTRCGKCVDACWHDGIGLGERAAKKNERCLGCGFCFAVCPAGALALPREALADALRLE